MIKTPTGMADISPRQRIRELVVRSDWLLDELERQNLVEAPRAEPVSVRRLDALLEDLAGDQRPRRPERPTPSQALEVVFAAQNVLLRQLAACKGGGLPQRQRRVGARPARGGAPPTPEAPAPPPARGRRRAGGGGAAAPPRAGRRPPAAPPRSAPP